MEPHLSVFEGFSGLEKEGEQSNVGEFVYENNDITFDVAYEAVRNILKAMN